MGYFLDANEGVIGLQHAFGIMSIFTFVGLIASYVFYQHSNSRAT
jgi:hypothetical protein